MANNLFANVPAATVAKQTITFAAAGFNAANTYIIYEVGNPSKSWDPNRGINPITTFLINKGYYIVPKTDMDMEAIVAPPLPTGGGGTPAAPTSGVVDDTANTFNWTNNPLFPDVSDYETTVNGGGAWITAVAKPLVVGDVNKAIGQVGVRVKAVGGNPASAWLFNATAFNVSGGATNRRTYSGYLERYEVPASPTDATKIVTRLSGSDRFIQRLKGDKHGLATVYDLTQLDAQSREPKHLVSGIEGRPAMELLNGQEIHSGIYPGASGFGFPCEIGMICKFPALPASTKYFAMSVSASANFDMAVTAAGELFIYVNPAGDFIHTGVTVVAGTTYHIVRRREANGDVKLWVNNVLVNTTLAYGSAPSILQLSLGGPLGDGAPVTVAEMWVSGSDNGAAAVLPTDGERTSLYADAKTEFPTLP